MGGFVFGYHSDPIPLAELEVLWSESRTWATSIPAYFSEPTLNSQGMRAQALTTQAPAETLSWSRSSAQLDPEATITLAKGLNEQQRQQLQQILVRAGVSPSNRTVVSVVRPDPKVWDPVEVEPEGVALASEMESDPCKLGFNHDFQHAGTTLCPERASALSRNHRAEGWVKVEGAAHLPTLIHQPAPNGGASLLLDSTELSESVLLRVREC